MPSLKSNLYAETEQTPDGRWSVVLFWPDGTVARSLVCSGWFGADKVIQAWFRNADRRAAA